jgi:hypothetical protein
MTTPAPLLVSDDVRAIEQALEAGPTLTEYPWNWHADPIKGDPLSRSRYEVTSFGRTITRTYYSDAAALTEAAYIAAANPARLRCILDTMRAQAEALAFYEAGCDANEGEACGYDGNLCCKTARAALTLYRGEAQ